MIDKMCYAWECFNAALFGLPICLVWLAVAWLIGAVVVLLPAWAVLLLLRAVQVAAFCAVCYAGMLLIQHEMRD